MPAISITDTILLNPSQTGLTLNAQIYDTSNAPVGGVITTGFTEIGGGQYTITYSVDSAQQGWIEIFTATNPTVLTVGAINPLAQGNVYNITPSAATAVFPTVSSATLNITQGDDYTAAGGNNGPIQWTMTGFTGSSVTGFTGMFSAVPKTNSADAPPFETTDLTFYATNQVLTVTMPLTDAQTSALTPGAYFYQLYYVDSNGFRTSVAIGTMNVKPSV